MVEPGRRRSLDDVFWHRTQWAEFLQVQAFPAALASGVDHHCLRYSAGVIESSRVHPGPRSGRLIDSVGDDFPPTLGQDCFCVVRASMFYQDA